MGVPKPFSHVVNAAFDTLGPPTLPNTFLRQVTSSVGYPPLMKLLPSDAVERATAILNEKKREEIVLDGFKLVREHVTNFISQRDNVTTHMDDILLTDAVSAGLSLAFQLIQLNDNLLPAGIMVPVPLYSLYSSLISKHGLTRINYHLSIDNNWELKQSELDRAYKEALRSCHCQPRAIAIINPGNPTGQIFRRETIEDIVKFAHHRKVFQLTLVSSEPFISVRKVVAEMHHPFNKVELISFNSISKGKGDFKAGTQDGLFTQNGFTNEPTLRGGYMEIYNIDPAIRAVLVQLLSVKQCPNLMGQVGLYAMVNPPIVVEPSYTLFEREKLAIFSNRKIVADKIVKFLNSIPGFYQPKLEAGFVVFPKITIPEKAVTLAVNAGTFPDVFYSLELLEATGIYVEVGSGYGLPSNQSHIKLIIPTSVDLVDGFLQPVKDFNDIFLKKYA